MRYRLLATLAATVLAPPSTLAMAPRMPAPTLSAPVVQGAMLVHQEWGIDCRDEEKTSHGAIEAVF